MRIVEQLVELARIWAEANEKSLSRLATIVINRGHFFETSIDQMNRSGMQTFEKFLIFFRDGGNWKGGRIPDAAVALLDNFENIATEAGASSGKSGDVTDAAAAAVAAEQERAA